MPQSPSHNARLVVLFVPVIFFSVEWVFGEELLHVY